MQKIRHKLKIFSKATVFCLSFVIAVFVLAIGVNFARAAWEEPSSEAPGGNIFTPLNAGPDDQAKKGGLLLDPMFNPYGDTPDINYPLEVRGPRDVYINYFDIAPEGELTVDTNTLYVDGKNDLIGIGTDAPTEELEIANGTINVGTAAEPVSGIGISASTQRAGDYAVYGNSQALNKPSVYGFSINNPGVYGVHTNDGVGIFAESQQDSAVVGTTDSSYDKNGPYIAGIYGRAYGLGSWAGYFEQRIFGSQEVVARKFLPNRLQYSQVPYTAGWEVSKIGKSILTPMSQMAFDGTNIWVKSDEGGWDYEPYYYLIDPATGALSDEFRVLSSGGVDAHWPNELIYEDGYMWSANGYQDSRGVSKINTDTHVAEIYSTGEHTGANDGAIDMVYDTTTNAASTYIWVPNYIVEGVYPNYTYSYGITRLQPSLGQQGSCTNASYNNRTDCESHGAIWQTPYGFCSNPVYNNTADCKNNGGTWSLNLTFNKVCPTLDQTQCSDGIDNDGDGKCDSGGCGALPADPDCSVSEAWAKPCVIGGVPTDSYDTQATCVAAGGSWVNDERLAYKQLGKPTAITFDGTNVWVAFYGWPSDTPYLDYQAAGLGKFNAYDPVNTKEAFCLGMNRIPNDITYGSGYLWTANLRRGGNTESVSRIDPAGVINEPHTGITNYNNLMPVTRSNLQIEYDDTTDNGNPAYLWVRNYYSLGKLRIDNTTKDLFNTDPGHGYSLPDDASDIAFERVTSGGPYVWTSHGATYMLTKNKINNPFTTYNIIPKGNASSGIAFDGTYVWSANEKVNTVAKYRASDGDKIGDYIVGQNPINILFDGTYIWTTNNNINQKLSKIRASDGVLISNYNYAQASNYPGNDFIFDGKYIWISDRDNSRIRIFDPAGCTAGSPGACTVNIYNPGITGPNRLMFDGQYVWVSHRDNKISRLSYNGTTLTVDKTITISRIATNNYNIQALAFDGTYVWVGTYYTDGEGKSVYKIDPEYAGAEPLTDSIEVYNDPGQCGAADTYKYCRSNLDCPNSTCDQNKSNVQQIVFDSTQIWVKHGGRIDYPADSNRECNDGQDNDGDGTCDFYGCGALPMDPDCANSADLHESATGVECNDNLDNDGNGKCDFDGAMGSPGCSGKPDPSCLNASGTPLPDKKSENNDYNEWGMVARVNAASGEMVEDVREDNYTYSDSGMLYDGTNIWISDEKANYILHKYYSGVGMGLDDMNAVVALQNTLPGSAQPGGFAVVGDAYLGGDLRVIGDLVVEGNTWAGSADNLENFSIGCDNGQFMKGIDTAASKLYCRGL
ncbi:MAG: hypothetical protein WCV50_03725 [Patescibacteria group bacterium]|jgi:hypothetical protein